MTVESLLLALSIAQTGSSPEQQDSETGVDKMAQSAKGSSTADPDGPKGLRQTSTDLDRTHINHKKGGHDRGANALRSVARVLAIRAPVTLSMSCFGMMPSTRCSGMTSWLVL